MDYTEIVDGFQIRDMVYIGESPEGKIEYDIVKWVDCGPHEVTELKTGEKKISTRYCYSIAKLEWNHKEHCFVFKSSEMWWLLSNITESVIKMILDFMETKQKELEELK